MQSCGLAQPLGELFVDLFEELYLGLAFPPVVLDCHRIGQVLGLLRQISEDITFRFEHRGYGFHFIAHSSPRAQVNHDSCHSVEVEREQCEPAQPLEWADMVDSLTGELQTFKAAFFRALGHPVRIRILEILVRGEQSVQELQEALGVEQPVVSQQLAVLRATNIVFGRKEGASVRYTVRDPLIATLLETARQIFNNHLVGTQHLLKQLQRERRR